MKKVPMYTLVRRINRTISFLGVRVSKTPSLDEFQLVSVCSAPAQQKRLIGIDPVHLARSLYVLRADETVAGREDRRGQVIGFPPGAA